MAINARILFKSHPDAMPTPDNFEIASVDLPPLEDGQFLLENVYLSLYPYLRMLMGRWGPIQSHAISDGTNLDFKVEPKENVPLSAYLGTCGSSANTG